MKSLKTTLLLLLMGLMAVSISAQDASVSEDVRPFWKKENGNALSMILEGQPKNVEAVMQKTFLAGTGNKGKTKSGVRLYEGVRYGEISNQMMDYYFKVEKASKSDKNSSRVTLFLSTGNYNFVDSDSYPDEITNATEVLQNLPYDVRLYEMDLAIEDQQKTLEKAIKSHDKMVKDSINLENTLAETLQAIEDNKHARANQRETIAQEEVRLQEFRERLDETMQESENAAVARRQARMGLPAAPATTTETEIIIDDNQREQEDKKD
ncbi:MAG: hypothetical protein AAF399_08945, partial [Bacteroidota bacterium]